MATRRLVGRSNQLLASLLEHLAEVEARGVHRSRACASLYTYAIYELRFSEDEAFRRVSAARLVRRFPALLEAIATGELHLTGLLMLGPHLTAENVIEVLLRAKHRTKKEIACLVRQLDPLPHVPPRIEPLGPAPSRPPRTPTWSRFVSALNPIRELEPGDRPRDWMDTATADAANAPDLTASKLASHDAGWRPLSAAVTSPEAVTVRLASERYRVQFEANEEYVELVERAKALLSHACPHTGLADLHLRAMRALVTTLEREKYATSATVPRVAAETRKPKPNVPAELEPWAAQEAPLDPQPGRADRTPKPPRQRGRSVPAAIRSAVFERDGGRCTYHSESGERCRETARLELHHKKAFARGGKHLLENVTLHCRAHNSLAAEEDFGKAAVARGRDSAGHESWATHAAGPATTPK